MAKVRVKGHSKVLRCTRCNTFISKKKGHTKSQCDSRIRKFKASKTKRRTHKRRSRKQK